MARQVANAPCRVCRVALGALIIRVCESARAPSARGALSWGSRGNHSNR